MAKDTKIYRKAVDVFRRGKVTKARKMLLELRTSNPEERLRVDIDLALLACLNQANDHSLLLEISDEGIDLSSKYSLFDAESAFCARKAVTLLQKQSHILHRMKCITLPPDWFGFATEREKREHEKLQGVLDQIIQDANSLFKKAKELASQEPKIQFHLLFDEAQAKSQTFNAYFFIYQQPTRVAFKMRWWAMKREQKIHLLYILKEVKKLFLSAGEMLARSGDATGFAYSYFNLALAYRSAWKYHQAKHYLLKAGDIATRYKMIDMLKRIDEVKGDIAQNKLSGENVDYKDFLPE